MIKYILEYMAVGCVLFGFILANTSEERLKKMEWYHFSIGLTLCILSWPIVVLVLLGIFLASL